MRGAAAGPEPISACESAAQSVRPARAARVADPPRGLDPGRLAGRRRPDRGQIDGSAGPFDPGRPIAGVLSIVGVLGALICLATGRSDAPAGAGQGTTEWASIGPLTGGLLLVAISGSAALGLDGAAGWAVVIAGLVIVVAVRLRWPALPTPFAGCSSRPSCWRRAASSGRSSTRLRAAAPSSASRRSRREARSRPIGTSPSWGRRSPPSRAVYYAMLIFAPRQVAEPEGGPVTWLLRFGVFLVSVLVGARLAPAVRGLEGRLEARWNWRASPSTAIVRASPAIHASPAMSRPPSWACSSPLASTDQRPGWPWPPGRSVVIVPSAAKVAPIGPARQLPDDRLGHRPGVRRARRRGCGGAGGPGFEGGLEAGHLGHRLGPLCQVVGPEPGECLLGDGPGIGQQLGRDGLVRQDLEIDDLLAARQVVDPHVAGLGARVVHAAGNLEALARHREVEPRGVPALATASEDRAIDLDDRPVARSRLSKSGASVARNARISATTTQIAANSGRNAAFGAGPVEVMSRTAMAIAPTAR